ncbi:hypothetical protein [Aphanothece hegewaldii]|uniref:hypothetical protein n=1 Tax=Aphanothece hegewaldii TaxID=1521625 RepID=UPI001C632648|nr:hypothetical protein [Aphanothece hegewaldii]
MNHLPNDWKDIQPDIVYQTNKGKFVAFAKTQIELGKKYDPNNKHLKAIEKGEVSPRGNMGLVPSEQEGYYLKSKVLGKGGDYRFHAKYIARSIKIDEDEQEINEQLYMILYFSGFMTAH